MKIQTELDIGQSVYLKTDPDQYERLITAIIIEPSDILYEISLGVEVSRHYFFEISLESNNLKLF